MWCESDSEKKLSDALKVIARHEAEVIELEKVARQKDAGLAGFRKERQAFEKTEGDLKDQLKKAKVDATMQVAYKASLRTMLDNEKEKFKIYKSESQKELNNVKEAEVSDRSRLLLFENG